MDYRLARPLAARRTSGPGPLRLPRHLAPALASALASGVLAACVGTSTVPETGEDVLRNDAAWLDEAHLTATLRGDDLALVMPLHRLAGDRLSGTLHVSLVDIATADTPRASVAVAFAQADEQQDHSVLLSGAARDLSRIGAATLVVAWRVEVAGSALYGRKSLYAALGQLEVELRGPTDVPRGTAAPVTVLVRQPQTMTAVAGAEVTAVARAVEQPGLSLPEVALFSGSTDERGELQASLSLPADRDEAQVRISVVHDGATLWNDSVVRSTVDRRLYLSIDKTIYKPGQTIEARLLCLDGTSRTAVAGAPVVFEAYDAKGNKVFKQRGSTDTFGLAAARVPLDTRVNEGAWRLRADVDGARRDLTIPVRRYNLPKLLVSVTPDLPYVLAGGTAHATVTARYPFGEPVVGAAVQLTAAVADGSFSLGISGTTDANGSFAFALAVPSTTGGAALDSAPVQLDLTGAVTDVAGQTQETGATLLVARSDLQLDAVVELGDAVPGVENTAYVLVSDPLGRPVAAAVQVRIDGGVAQAMATGAGGSAPFSFVPAVSDQPLSLELSAVDGAGRAASRTLSVARGAAGGLQVTTDAALYRAGDEAQVTVLAPTSVARAFVTVRQGLRQLWTSPVDLAAGRADLRLALTSELRGVLTFEAFALAGAGEVLTGARRAIVDPENGLAVTVASDATTYAPGGDAQLAVQVTRADGQPVVAAVGLTVVNEQSFALGGEPTGDIRTFFDADERVLPATALLGRSTADLFGALPFAERRDLARLLLGRAGTPASSANDFNSVKVEAPAVVAALQNRVSLDLQGFLESLTLYADGGVLTSDNFATQLPALGLSVIDPFGRQYRLTTSKQWGSNLLRLASGGPDERFGTLDDLQAETWADWLFYQYRNLEGDVAMGGGGPVMDEAGGPPQAPGPNDGTGGTGGSGGGPATGAPGGVRVRSDFRETVLAQPSLITDAAGRAAITVPLADAITTWRATAEASTAAGEVGAGRAALRTFRSFFVDFDLPLALTAGDVVRLPAVVYNYQPTATTIEVSLGAQPWFAVQGATTQTLTLGPSEVRAVPFDIEVLDAGAQTLMLSAAVVGGAGEADALVRSIEVTPSGYAEDQTFSDRFTGVVTHVVDLPADAVAGGTTVELSLTPGFAAEAVEGTESLLQEPNGCFEQTTSTAWPNTLVTNYLEQTGQLTDELRAHAFDLVTRGYQRLLTFESPTGGFNWWGDSDPGNRILSAIMLWHTKDLESLIETDDAVRDRTLAWLLAQQRADGSWDGGDALHAGDEVLSTSNTRTTAFIAWALAHTSWADAAVAKAASWLRVNLPPASDLYATALVANALAFADPAGGVTSSVLATLDGLKEERPDGRVLWPSDTPSWTGAGGDAAALETTGLASYALLAADAFPESAAAGLRFLVANKDAIGTWYNTQATMNALRALSAAASPRGSEAEGSLEVRVNGALVATLDLTAADGDVLRKVDLTGYVAAGANDVELRFTGVGEVPYRLNRRVYRPAAAAPVSPLRLDVAYDRTATAVGDPVVATVIATNDDLGVRDQVMVRLGRAPGFAPRAEDLDALVAQSLVSRYEVRDDDVTFYLMALQGGESRQLQLRLTPSLAQVAAAPPSSIYPYYEPTAKAVVPEQVFTVAGP